MSQTAAASPGASIPSSAVSPSSAADAPAALSKASSPLWLAAWSLWKREIVRFYRQPSRVIGALSSPLLFWMVAGSGMNKSFATGEGGVHYLEYFFPGIAALVALFTAIMSMASVIEDRDAGFLQGALASPAPRSAIALGKIMGGTTLAFLQGLVFLAVAPMAGFSLTPLSIAAILAATSLLGFGLTGLGFLLAWNLESFQGFHVLMNLLLMPMWMLSGALFPASGASGWVTALMAANPMTYGVESLRQAFYVGMETAPAPLWGVSAWAATGITAAFGAAVFAIAAFQTSRQAK